MYNKNIVKVAIPLLSISFFSFILWVIYLANTGQNSMFFRFIAAIPYGDKLGHFCLFGGLTLLANFALRLKVVKLGSLSLYWGTILVSAFVIIEEASQYFIPNRNFDLIDLTADFIGIGFFTLCTAVIQKQLLLAKSNA